MRSDRLLALITLLSYHTLDGVRVQSIQTALGKTQQLFPTLNENSR